MPLLDLTNPEIARYIGENYDKAARLRLKWIQTYGDKVKTMVQEPKERKTCDEIRRITVEAGMPNLAKDHMEAGRFRKRVPIRDCTHIPGVADLKKGHSIPDVGLGDPKDDPRLDRPDNDPTWDPPMRIIDPEHKSILYKNVPEFGRAVYLKKRHQIIPEDKYYFSECPSWDYGWRLKDGKLSSNRPSYGRVWRYNSISRSGPHPDPTFQTHNPNIGVHNKHSEIS